MFNGQHQIQLLRIKLREDIFICIRIQGHLNAKQNKFYKLSSLGMAFNTPTKLFLEGQNIA